ncbi:hypothetical protein OIU76_026651 [Salix suchowensis]|nr:hypothetical protein OIU76_026651 [Salix suchowensis]
MMLLEVPPIPLVPNMVHCGREDKFRDDKLAIFLIAVTPSNPLNKMLPLGDEANESHSCWLCFPTLKPRSDIGRKGDHGSRQIPHISNRERSQQLLPEKTCLGFEAFAEKLTKERRSSGEHGWNTIEGSADHCWGGQCVTGPKPI